MSMLSACPEAPAAPLLAVADLQMAGGPCPLPTCSLGEFIIAHMERPDGMLWHPCCAVLLVIKCCASHTSTTAGLEEPLPLTNASTSALCLPQGSMVRLTVDPGRRDVAADGVPFLRPVLAWRHHAGNRWRS